MGCGELFELSLFFPFEEEEEEDRSFSLGRTDAWASDGVVNPEKDSPEKDDGFENRASERTWDHSLKGGLRGAEQTRFTPSGGTAYPGNYVRIP